MLVTKISKLLALEYDVVTVVLLSTGFIRSGKIRGKHIFFEMVRESQGKLGKSQGNFFGKFLPPMNQDPLFILAVVC